MKNQVLGLVFACIWTLASCQSPLNVQEAPEASHAFASPDFAASRSGSDIAYNGNDNGRDVVLQAFHWNANSASVPQGNWYLHLQSLAPEIRSLFSAVWLPPPSSSAAPQGYMPSDWANLNSAYGSAQNLRDLLTAFRTGTPRVYTLADIVVNHRSAFSQGPTGVWDQYNFPSFPMSFWDFMDQSVDVIGNGGVKSNANVMVSGVHEGSWSIGGRTYWNEDFSGSPDINHWNAGTRGVVSSWLGWLKNVANAGFDGWRFDMIGGYDPAYLGEYNLASSPYLSVGEKPTGGDGASRQLLADIVNRSGNRTMVFDFAMRASLESAFADVNNFYGQNIAQANAANSNYGLVGWWSHAAMTFVNNHDMQPGHTSVGQPFPWGTAGSTQGLSTQAAYAFILTHPGIPKVFFMDWKDRGSGLTTAINNLIRIRQANNVHRGSRVWVARAENGLYAAYIGDENNEQVAIKIGKSGWGNYEGWVPAGSLGLNQAFTRWEAGGHAFTVFYKNAVPLQ